MLIITVSRNTVPEDHCLCTIATAEAFRKQALELTQLRARLLAGKPVVATPFLIHGREASRFELAPEPNSQGAAFCGSAGMLPLMKARGHAQTRVRSMQRSTADIQPHLITQHAAGSMFVSLLRHEVYLHEVSCGQEPSMHETLRVPSPEPFSQSKEFEQVMTYWAPDGAALLLQFLVVDPEDARSTANPDDFFEVNSDLVTATCIL